jgi:transcriptional regulator with XRE-family HTH domain
LGHAFLNRRHRTSRSDRPFETPPAMKKRRPNSTDVQVGESIRAHRLIAGMSQSDLAKRLGVSFQQVQKYEKGANRIGAGRLPQIASIFNIPIGALFEANADASPGKGTKRNIAPVNLISDKSALRLLGSYSEIANPPIRRRLIQLVDEIAKATRK